MKLSIEWANVVGPENVTTDEAALADLRRCTFGFERSIAGVVRPASRDEVIQCVKLARRLRTPVYPVSGGKNWGLGSRLPTSDGCVVLDLSRMNRIIAFDEELAYVTVEPGVTFQSLYEFLAERKSQLFIPISGTSPRASIVGNTLERGDGTGPYADRAAHVCDMEVVLGTGDCIRTGFGNFDESPLGPLHRWGVGPALDGIFTQSNFGIVTSLTAWLNRLPRSLAIVRYGVTESSKLDGLVDRLRELRFDGTFRGGCSLLNDYRYLTITTTYPWSLSPETPLASRHVKRLSRAWGGLEWFGLAAVYGASEDVGTAAAEHARKTLESVADMVSVRVAHGDGHAGAEIWDGADVAFPFFEGRPHEIAMRSVYWRKRVAAPKTDLDPDRDRCGAIWICATLPFRGCDVTRADPVVAEVCTKWGFEPMIAMAMPAERVIYFYPLIIYDRDEAGADERALKCHDELVARLNEMGYVCNRLGVQSMGALPPREPSYAALLERLRELFDPDGIVAPGRYTP